MPLISLPFWSCHWNLFFWEDDSSRTAESSFPSASCRMAILGAAIFGFESLVFLFPDGVGSTPSSEGRFLDAIVARRSGIMIEDWSGGIVLASKSGWSITGAGSNEALKEELCRPQLSRSAWRGASHAWKSLCGRAIYTASLIKEGRS